MLSKDLAMPNKLISLPPPLILTDTEKIQLWEKGSLGYLLRLTQKVLKHDWIESKKFSRKFYAESTRRLGKSSFLLMLMVEECKKKRPV